MVEAQRQSRIPVFISHSSEDALLAQRILELLRMALNLRGDQIRCLSVAGYGLPAGADISDQIRDEVTNATVLIALLTESSVRSTFVLFELGARWGTAQPFFPLLATNYSAELIRAPLNATNALSCGSAAQLHQLVSNVGDALGCAPESAATYERYVSAVLDAFNASVTPSSQGTPPVGESASPLSAYGITIPLPRPTKASDAAALEQEQSFTARIAELRVTESTSVRCRYDFSVEIHNNFPSARGFFGSIALRDPNGYEVARKDYSIVRPLRAPANGEETYTSFLYLAPEHARLIASAELSLVPRDLHPNDLFPAVTREWNGIWPE